MSRRGSLWLIAMAFGLALPACRSKTQKLPEKPGKCLDGAHCRAPKVASVCSNGVQFEMPCRGPGGCSEDGQSFSCDNLLATPGDACNAEHDFACALDQKAVLECQAGKFKVVESYSKNGCTAKDGDLECDASPKLPCDELEDIACCLVFARRVREPAKAHQ